MFQEILVLIFVLAATVFALRSFYKQFASPDETGCSSCSTCTIPAADSMHSSYFNEKRQRDIKYKRIK